MSNLIIFEGMNIDILTKEDVNFEFDGSVLFHGSQTANLLGYKDGNDAIKVHVEDEFKYLVTKDKLKGEIPFSLGQRGNWFITDDGVIDLTYKSKLPTASDFRKKVREIIKKVQLTGKFDEVENQIVEIEDEKEKQLQLKIYKLEQVLEISPEDRMMLITLNDTKKELELYRQSRKLEQVENTVKELTQTVVEIEKVNKVLQEQSKFICDRTNFYERVKILANKYFGRDIQKAYQELFSTMKMLGSFDVYSRRKNEWEKINAERGKNNKKPLKDSSLKSKYNFLDVIDDYNKWELASEAYKMIENKFVSG